jgi:hypothetical protein
MIGAYGGRCAMGDANVNPNRPGYAPEVGKGEEGFSATGAGGYDRRGRYIQSASFGEATQLGGQGFGGAYGQGFGGASYREEMGLEYDRRGERATIRAGEGTPGQEHSGRR